MLDRKLLIDRCSPLIIEDRCHFVAAQRAAKLMVTQKDGLIVNISSGGALFDIFTTTYGVGKAGVSLNVYNHAGAFSSVVCFKTTVTLAFPTYHQSIPLRC